MSYAVSAALQNAVYQTLMGDTVLSALVGPNIYDAVPSGTLPSLYVSLGPEVAKDMSDKTGAGAAHDFTVSVVTDSAGFAAAKEVAAAVSDALIDAELTLARGALVSLRFVKAATIRIGTGDLRQINMVFRAIVADE